MVSKFELVALNAEERAAWAAERAELHRQGIVLEFDLLGLARAAILMMAVVLLVVSGMLLTGGEQSDLAAVMAQLMLIP